MKKLLAAAGIAAAFAMPAAAETMTCKNPRREYRVEFDGKNFLAKSEEGTTPYRVTNVVDMPDGRLVIGKAAGADGLNFEADFGDREIRYFMDGAGAALQTDDCRPAKAKTRTSTKTNTDHRAQCERDWAGDPHMIGECIRTERQADLGCESADRWEQMGAGELAVDIRKYCATR